jgi:ketosteroid isomerase-like protein
MRAFRWIAAAAAASLAAVAAARGPEPPSLEEIARRYVAAQERAMRKDAGPSDVDAVLADCTDSFRYLHPAFGAQVDGKDAARKGMRSHLGETSQPSLAVEKAMVTGRTVALDVRTSFVDVETGKKVERRNLWVLSFDGDRISLRADFQ